jgi:hypothetical protein
MKTLTMTQLSIIANRISEKDGATLTDDKMQEYMDRARVKYARKSDVTGQGMNEGYCFADGAFYCENREDAIKEIRKDVKEFPMFFRDAEQLHLYTKKQLTEMSDEGLMETAYHNNYYYYTEWNDDRELDVDGWYTEDGTRIEIDANDEPYITDLVKDKVNPNDYEITEHGDADFNEWINSDNVIQKGEDKFIEQTTQWKKEFTRAELREFFEREYNN